ncbi:hypothetical protein FDP41_001322 [Naegleria fowleri]|uniref:NYN domain-containing protein n=1 Tax=Naegleria fowleri TaxID=5763 RepID=A0A6A5BZ74_NAEFO|nr:uncharacterized protein FDP41_001322 [Naegleria fowleri]KAF0979654.1 hypothetical protein FDP41_001322 [Naegleria fowleri]
MTVHNHPFAAFQQQLPSHNNFQRTTDPSMMMMMKNNNTTTTTTNATAALVPIKLIIKKKIKKTKSDSTFTKPPKPALLLHEDSVSQRELSFETFTQNIYRLLGVQEEFAKMKIKVRRNNEMKKFKAIRDEKKWNKVVEKLLAHYNGSPIEFKIVVKVSNCPENKALIPLQHQAMQQPASSQVGRSNDGGVVVLAQQNVSPVAMKNELVPPSAPPSIVEEQVQHPLLNVQATAGHDDNKVQASTDASNLTVAKKKFEKCCFTEEERLVIKNKKAEIQLLKSQIKLKKQDLKNYKNEIKNKKKEEKRQSEHGTETLPSNHCHSTTAERIYPTLVSFADEKRHKHHHGKELKNPEKLLWKQQKKLEKEKKKLEKESHKQIKRELKLKKLEHKQMMRAQIAINMQDDVDLSNGDFLNIPSNVTQIFIDGNNMFFMTKTLRDLILKNKDKVMVEKLIIHIAQKFAQILSDNRQPLKMLHICFDSASLQVICEKDTFVVSSATQRGFTTADDMLVDLAMRQNVAGSVDSCLFVTSDLALRERLRNAGAKCIGSGLWMKSCYQKLCVNTELQSLDDWMAVELKELNYTL